MGVIRDGRGTPQPVLLIAAGTPNIQNVSRTDRVSGTVSPAAAAPPSPTPPPAAQAAAEPVQPDGAVPLTSPIVGTFYRSPSPDASPFVEIGSKINKGQVLCIVEAMKVMNEIESEIDAEVIDVFVANGQTVEYGETLFLLRPLS